MQRSGELSIPREFPTSRRAEKRRPGSRHNWQFSASPAATTESTMTAADFRRIALSLEGAEEGSHMGAADFRVGGRIFATLAAEKQGYGNLMLTAEQQAAFGGDMPEVFVPIARGW